MPKVSWSAFIELHPAAHLVAGVIPEEDVATVTARDSLALLAKLAKRLSLTGQYAMTVDRRSGHPEINCAFARETDAGKVRTSPRCDRRGPLPRLGKPAKVRAGHRGHQDHRQGSRVDRALTPRDMPANGSGCQAPGETPARSHVNYRGES